MAVAIMQEIMLLAAPLNATQVTSGGSNVDSGPWGQAGVPFGAPMIANQVCGLLFQCVCLFGLMISACSLSGLFSIPSHGRHLSTTKPITCWPGWPQYELTRPSTQT
jgi:hypothetical protein